MPPKKVSAAPTATIPKDSEIETIDAKTGLQAVLWGLSISKMFLLGFDFSMTCLIVV